MLRISPSNKLHFNQLWLLAILLGVALAFSSSQTVQAQDPPDELDDYYGINFIAPYEPWLTLARESGAGVVRWQFNWRDHEPNPGQWQWETSDEHIATWNQAGIDIHAIMHFPPEWALVNPPFGFVPKGVELAWNDPNNGWGEYCSRFAQRYRGKIDSYEIWNEPDLNNYWDGTSEQYFYVLRSCYQAIKAADPNATVVMAGMALFIEPEFLPQVIRRAAIDPQGAANNHYFDAVAIHMYADPGLAYDLTVSTRTLLDNFGFTTKPIWITETNIALHPSRDAEPNWEFASEEEAGWYMLQVSSNALAAGAERLMIFRLADDGMDKAYGLVRNDATVRPSYEAFQMATSFMSGVVSAKRLQGGNIVVNQMTRDDGARVILAYSQAGTPQTVEIDAGAPAAVLINAGGGYSTIEPDIDNHYTVTLLPARGRDFDRPADYTVGGPPVLIVESDVVAPTVRMGFEPLTPERALITWEGTDGEYGTGVRAYTVQVKRDGGQWVNWREATDLTEAVFEFDSFPADSYEFRAFAVDRAGNVSTPPESGMRLTGRLTVQVVDLRGRPVPNAELELANGATYQSNVNGLIDLTPPDNSVQVSNIRASDYGESGPIRYEVGFGETVVRTVQLAPPNAVLASTFETSAGEWEVSSPRDARLIDGPSGFGLLLSGQRRAYGTPAIELEVQVPLSYQSPVLTFDYTFDATAHTLRLHTEDVQGRRTLWSTEMAQDTLRHVVVDLPDTSGETIMLRFELLGSKVSQASQALLDNIYIADVP